jgi:hypothetical protein
MGGELFEVPNAIVGNASRANLALVNGLADGVPGC